MDKKDREQQTKSELILRYFRKVIAHPDGAIVHHADCHIYSCIGICTCGLHHDLMPLDEDTVIKLYPKVKDEVTREGLIDSLLRHHEEGKLYEVCSECNGTGWKKKESFWGMLSLSPAKCPICSGRGVIKYLSPKLCSNEEAEKIFKEAGWGEGVFKMPEEKSDGG